MPSIDLNCDLGEGAGQDEALMPLVSSANIACGAHAGDPATMRATAALAALHGVAVGAHPGYPNRSDFGRAGQRLAADVVQKLVEAQVRALREMAPIRHVKPHGALYNQAARDRALAAAVVAAIRGVDDRLMVFGPPGSALLAVAVAAGLPVAAEFFADRGYQADGTLVPRGREGALIADEAVAAERVIRAVETGLVRTVDGGEIKMQAETICLHGDGPLAVPFARRIRRELEARGWSIRPPETRLT